MIRIIERPIAPVTTATVPSHRKLSPVMTTTPATDLEVLIAKVKAAQKQFATFTQEQVDLIFRKAAFAAAGARTPWRSWRWKRPAWD